MFSVRADSKDATGQALKTGTFRFDTGGPQAVAVRPWDGSTIDEQQAFILAFDARVKPGTLAAHASCRVRGLADRIEVEVLQGAQRDAALAPLKAKNDPLFRRRFAPNADTIEVVRCKRPLPNEAEVSLVLERGIEAGNGLASSEPQTFVFQVRPAFRVRATCDKVNARAACNPLTPIRVSFGGRSGARTRAQVRLAGGGRSWRHSWTMTQRRSLGRQPALCRAVSRKIHFTLSLPANLRDDDGRALANAAAFPMTIRTDATPPLAKFSSGSACSKRRIRCCR